MSAKEGDLLFEGQRKGRSYEGTAYLFSQACGKVGYAVSGFVGEDDRTVSMNGSAPRRNAQCQVAGYAQDQLNFSFLVVDKNARQMSSGGPDTATQTGSTAISSMSSIKETYEPYIADGVVIGEIASDASICKVLQHPLMQYESVELNSLPTSNSSIRDEGLGSKWLLERNKGSALPGRFRVSTETYKALEKNVFACLKFLNESNKRSYQSAVKFFFPYLESRSCLVDNNSSEKRLNQDGRLVEFLNVAPRNRCVDFGYDGGNLRLDYLGPTIAVALLTIKEGQPALITILDNAKSVLDTQLISVRERNAQIRKQQETAEKIQVIQGRGDLTSSEKNRLIQQLSNSEGYR